MTEPDLEQRLRKLRTLRIPVDDLAVLEQRLMEILLA
jgi:hypothetical protein